MSETKRIEVSYSGAKTRIKALRDKIEEWTSNNDPDRQTYKYIAKKAKIKEKLKIPEINHLDKIRYEYDIKEKQASLILECTITKEPYKPTDPNDGKELWHCIWEKYAKYCTGVTRDKY